MFALKGFDFFADVREGYFKVVQVINCVFGKFEFCGFQLGANFSRLHAKCQELIGYGCGAGLFIHKLIYFN